MKPYEVIRALTDGRASLSDALRQMLVVGVAAEGEISDWVNAELTGYTDLECPDYRVSTLDVRGDASNGAWRHSGIAIPISSLPKDLKEYAIKEHSFVMSVVELERYASSGDTSFKLPWEADAVGHFNALTRAGDTPIERGYQFTSVWWEVSVAVVDRILSVVRQRALNILLERTPAEERVAAVAADMGFDDKGQITVSGVGNQVMVDSPGSGQSIVVSPGDWTAVEQALIPMGVTEETLAELNEELADPDWDDDAKISKAVRAARRLAGQIGVNGAGSTIATVLLNYLGVL